MNQTFQYEQAFERNLGWLTPEEQARLRKACVAIAGMGGTGGYQATALARLGVTKFKLADPDIFEMTNFNRQLGATVSTLGQSKVEVIRKMILDINPEARVDVFPKGIDAGNVAQFLEGADLAVDGIDFFQVGAKKLLFEESRKKRIVAVTSCPVGFGASLLVFSPTGMKFADYFDIREGMSDKEIKFAMTFGLSPAPLCLKYMNKKAVDFKTQRASSNVTGLALVGAVTAAESVRILTGKWKSRPVPYVTQWDLLTQQFRIQYFPWGMKSPWQRFKKWALIKLLKFE